MKHAERYGIEGVGAAKLNWKGVLARKDDVITRHTNGLDFLMKKNKIATFKGFGRLTGLAKDGVHTVEVKLADGKTETVKAKKVVLATGSDAKMLPGVKADETVLTNYEILKIAELPKSLVVIGSGAVGVEFASIFKSFGAEVTILEMLPRMVPVEDEEIGKELLRLMKKRGFDVNLSDERHQNRKKQGWRACFAGSTPTARRRASRRRGFSSRLDDLRGPRASGWRRRRLCRSADSS